jgi:ribosome-associated protein
VANGDRNHAISVARRSLGDLPLRVKEPEGGPLNTAIASSRATSAARVALEHACLCARVAGDNKARDILVLDMRGQTPLYDYFVIATGTSRRQIHTVAEEVDAAMRAEGEQRLSIEGYEASKWVVQDYGDVVVHLFSPEARQYYRLEELWDDAERVAWERI